MEKMNFVPWTDVVIDGGFWKGRQEAIEKGTSKAIYDRFYETGRIEAMKLEWKEGMPKKPHEFWDSDVAKWLEGTMYLLYFHKDQELQDKVDEIIGYIEKGQTEDGYFNSAFLTHKPKGRFTDRTDHELYTAGHLIEAAVAHYYSTGSDRFLKMMCRFADCIEKAFVLEKTAKFATPGHQEIELALVRLWQATGEKRYLELSKHFVDTRGTQEVDRVFSVQNGTYPACPPMDNQLYYDDTYAQDNAPARELPEAGGHAVRAMYFYTAMADISREYGDQDLFEACKRLWNDSVMRKMYITGGVSAERYGEAIGTAYVLPNDHAYAETCASVAMANFSQRMLQLEPDGKYADMIERQMYNGALVGVSIDGTAFYYDNSMRSRPAVNRFFEGIHATPLWPANQRLKVFECSCCPPNIYRFIAAMGQYFYSVQGNTLYLHQYAENTASVTVAGSELKVSQKTAYPWNGDVTVSLEMEKPLEMTVAIRIPGWCRNAKAYKNGEELPMNTERGYLYLDGAWQNGDQITLDFPMPAVQMESHPGVVDTAGKVALMRGPLVYCLESQDNDFDIFDLSLPRETAVFRESELEIDGLPVVTIQGIGFVREEADWSNLLYRPFTADYRNVEFTAVPYFAWANRGENDMTIWVKKQG